MVMRKYVISDFCFILSNQNHTDSGPIFCYPSISLRIHIDMYTFVILPVVFFDRGKGAKTHSVY